MLTGKKMPKRSPVADDNCTACGRCKEICPRDALKLLRIEQKLIIQSV